MSRHAAALAALLSFAGCEADERTPIDASTATTDASADAMTDATATDASDDAVDADPTTVEHTNSNACLADLGALQPVCPADASGVPDAACCQAFAAFQADACGCSPFIANVMGTDAASGASRRDQLVDGLTLVCPALGVEVPSPDCTSPTTPSGRPSGAAHTYAGGACADADWELDALRYHSFLAFQTFFATYGDPSIACVDIETLVAELAPAFDADAPDGESPSITVPYGIGKYKTVRGMVEYLAMTVPIVVKDLWRVSVSDAQTADSMLYIAPDGARIAGGNHGEVRAFDDCVTSAEGYFESVAEFVGCSPTIHAVRVPSASEAAPQLGKPTVMPKLIDTIYLAATKTDRWGAVDICQWHERYCKGDNKQYASYADCLAFLRALPAVSPACGEGRMLSGNSFMCRFKHHFMTPFDPSAHCFHIGPGDRPDAHGHMKCNDEMECATPGTEGPKDLLDLTPTSAEASCLDAADDGSGDGGSPSDAWPTVAVCPAR